MLIFVGGFFGVVLMPFVLLLLPFLIWYALPTALWLGVLYTVRNIKRPRTAIRARAR